MRPAAPAPLLAAALLLAGCAQTSAPGPQAAGEAGGAAASRDAPLGEALQAPRPDGLPPPGSAAASARLAGEGSWADRGARLLAAGRAAAAADAFRRAMAAEGPGLRAMVGLGAARRAQGLTGEARRILRRAAERWPESPVARNNHGAALYDLGRYAAAESEFRAAAELMARRGVAPTSEILRNLDLAARARAGEGAPPAGAAPPAVAEPSAAASPARPETA